MGRANCPNCFQLREDTEKKEDSAEKGNEGKKEDRRHKAKKGPKIFSADAEPRLYEVGRHGAFDISTDPPRHPLEYASIHPLRPDLEAYSETRRNLKWIVGTVATAAILILGVMLISSTAFRGDSSQTYLEQMVLDHACYYRFGKLWRSCLGKVADA